MQPEMFFKHSPRRPRTPPAGFIRPAQPALVGKPPIGPGWLHEVKHDGYWLIALKEGARVKLWTRHCTDYTSKFPRIADAIRALPTERALLDGEAVMFRPDGLSDFKALVTTHGAERASFVVFDLLSLEGEDWRLRPIEERRQALSRLVAGAGAIVFSETIEGEGELVFEGLRDGRRRDRVEAGGQLLPERPLPQLAENEEPGVRPVIGKRGLFLQVSSAAAEVSLLSLQ
jgi:ATP-dependent DNA ligase